MGNIIGGTLFVSMLYYHLYNKEMERWPRLLAFIGIGRLAEILLNHLGSQRSYLAGHANSSYETFPSLLYIQRR